MTNMLVSTKILKFNHLKAKLPLSVILVSCISLAIFGCGKGRHPSSTSSQIADVQFLEAENIKEPELSVAKRVCYAYKSKRSAFKTNYHGKDFKFDFSKKDCSSVEDSKVFMAKLKSPVDATTLTWIPVTEGDSFEFMTNIQDDESGYLKQLCERVFRGATISNSLKVNSSETVQVQFKRSNIDQYQINFFSLQNNVQVLMSSDLFKVRTQFDVSNGQILGFDEEITRFKKCASQNKYQEFVHKVIYQ